FRLRPFRTCLGNETFKQRTKQRLAGFNLLVDNSPPFVAHPLFHFVENGSLSDAAIADQGGCVPWIPRTHSECSRELRQDSRPSSQLGRRHAKPRVDWIVVVLGKLW